MTERPSAPGGSQTLARGLLALAMIGESQTPLTVADLAERLGIHRSMANRLVLTLEQHGFATRNASGQLEVGARVAAISRGVARDLQTATYPELLEIANRLEVTAFLVTYDGEAAVTLISAEPQLSQAPVGQRPGTRHSIDRGAPGRVIRSQIDPANFPALPFESSHDEVLPGITAIAVPLTLPSRRPASLAALYVSSRGLSIDEMAAELAAAAARVREKLA